MNSHRAVHLILAVSASVLAAPAGAAAPKPSAPAASAATSPLQAAIALAKADAVQRSGQPLERIRVKQAAQVVWPDGSLGCPKPDEMYTQALVPGFRIQLNVGGQRYDYHADTQGLLRLCPAGASRGTPRRPETSGPVKPAGAHA